MILKNGESTAGMMASLESDCCNAAAGWFVAVAAA